MAERTEHTRSLGWLKLTRGSLLEDIDKITLCVEHRNIVHNNSSTYIIKKLPLLIGKLEGVKNLPFSGEQSPWSGKARP